MAKATSSRWSATNDHTESQNDCIRDSPIPHEDAALLACLPGHLDEAIAAVGFASDSELNEVITSGMQLVIAVMQERDRRLSYNSFRQLSEQESHAA